MPTLTKDEEQIHELRDLEVQEVSLVDRPANKRKFLIIKNAEADVAKGAKLKKDGEGGAPPAPADEDVNDAAGAGEGGAPNVDDEFEEVELAGMKLPEDVAKALGSALTRAAKRLAAIAQAVEQAEKADDGEVPPALMRQIAAVARTLEGIGKAEKDEDSDTEETSEGDDDKSADGEVDAEKAFAALFADVDKAGRKMSRGRLKQLKTIRDMIGKLLEDVDDVEDEEPTAAKKAADGNVAKLLEAVDKLQTLVKSQSSEIKRLKKGRPSPNSGTVEEDQEQTTKRTVWPANFNEEEKPDDITFR